MNKQSIHITVNEPCNMGWDNMNPAKGGRFCNACEKVVVDFTSMSDEELIMFFTNRTAGDSPCGHFRKDQLDKTIAIPQPRKPFKFLKLAASFLMAQALFYQEQAFGRTNHPVEIVNPADTTRDAVLKITGRVADYHSDKPVGGVKVYIEGTEYYSITDNNGRFTVVVAGNIKGEVTLLTEYENDKNFVAGSIIPSKKGAIEDLVKNELILYRYPEEPLDEIEITEFMVPLIDGMYTGGAPAIITHVEKETFWHRLTKVFRKK